MQNQNSLLTLEYVINQVNTWRSQKKHRSELMPESLKILIVRLAPLHSAYKIASSLRISLATFYNFKKTYSDNTINQEEVNITQSHNNPSKAPDEQRMDFIPFQIIPLSLPESPESPSDTINAVSDASIICQIIKPNGTKLVITTNNPDTIMKSFLCYS